jgi:4-alpha-glucanotransferase
MSRVSITFAASRRVGKCRAKIKRRSTGAGFRRWGVNFHSPQNRLGELPIIAEDLGVITPDVESLRDDFGFPGMRILQFAFSGDPRNKDLPHNYTRNTVVYTGTHDNDTTIGWFKSRAGEGSTRNAAQVTQEHKFCLDYLNTRGSEIHWDLIRAALASVADLAIIPLQDVLGLGAEARMNLPSSVGGNWSWRYPEDALSNIARERLKEMTLIYGRA